MSLLDTASLILTPNGYKASKLYSVKPTDASGDMTVVRATTATRVNSAGLIESVAINVPRLDYTGGGCPSILVEPQRTNLALRSEELDTALIWFPVAATVTANNATSPDGTVNADKLIATAVSSTHIILQQPAGSVSGTTSSVSIFAKASGLSNIQILNNAGGLGVANFNLSTGTATLSSGVSATIQNYGNGWYRCIVTYTPTTTGNYNIQIRLADSSGTTTFLGNGVDGVSLWGFQIEAGSNATSYIPTVASTVTRTADVISKTGISSLIGQTEGTLYAEVNLDNFEVNNVRIFAISDGTSANRIMLLTNSSNRITTIVSNSSVEQAQISSGTLTKGLYKIAVAYALNDFAFYINGALIGVDSSINVPICTDVYLGKIESSSPTAILNDRIELATLFKTRLTNAQLATLTTL